MISAKLVKLKRLFKRFRLFLNEEVVFVYQMGKVGSTSLEQSIEGAQHFHTLYMNGPCYVSDRRLYRGVGGVIRLWLRDLVKRLAFALRRDVKIITVVRNPVDRNISMFFQELAFWISDYIERHDSETRFSDIQWLHKVYEVVYCHDYGETWFDKEIKRLSGIDVFAEPFDVQKGYAFFTRGKYNILVLRMEDIGRNVDVISGFVGREIELKRTNEAEKKWYSSVYREFKRSFDPDRECVRVIAEGRVARHFGYLEVKNDS